MKQHTETLTRYIANFIDELAKSGVTDIVISPGSRSTPLAMTVLEHPHLKEWIIVDERSASFFALGMAKQSKRPVALICTSGTAAANYYPAVVEAYYSRVPLLVLTADRPHELRDVGAPQAINQMKLYSTYPKWFHEMALPENSQRSLDYARSKASQAVSFTKMANAGPVHLNFPLREPLVPDFTIENVWGISKGNHVHHPVYNGFKRLTQDMLHSLREKIHEKKRGVIVVGPQTDKQLAKAVTNLAQAWQLPVLADPLSQIRSGNHDKQTMIEGYDAFLREEKIRDEFAPDFIIRFGAMPVSKAYLFYVQQYRDVTQFVVEDIETFRDPSGVASEFIDVDPTLFCEDVLSVIPKLSDVDTKWLLKWRQANDMTKSHLHRGGSDAITEGEAVRSMFDVIPHEGYLYVGNSMAVRDVDTFCTSTDKPIHVLANRGANGIEGMISSGLGAAAHAKQPVTLLLGDLSFFHDLNGLLAGKHYPINLTILLINNDGGGIFSFLPQADNGKHFETLFGTPLGINFQQVIDMYGGMYHLAKTENDVKMLLKDSYQQEGVNVIEVKTNRTENATWHKALWHDIQQAIMQRQEESQ